MIYPLVSIVVPVYNTGKYLTECLESLCNQTYQNIEIVCVDDGSFDDSQVILQAYADKDNRFNIASQKNSGQSVARNKALEMSNGNFVMFVDSDDYLAADAIQKCVDAIKSEPDLDGVVFNAETFRDYLGSRKIIRENEELIIDKHRGRVMPPAIDVRASEHIAVFTNACQLFISRELIAQNDIRFVEGKIFEDSEFCAHILCLSKKLYWIEEPLYFYRRHTTSTVASAGPRFLEAFEMFCKAEQHFKDAGIWDLVEHCFYVRYLGHLMGFWHNDVKNSKSEKLIAAYKKGLIEYIREIPLLMLYSVLQGFHKDKMFLLEMRDDIPHHIYASIRKNHNREKFRERVKRSLRNLLIKLSPGYRLSLDTRDKVNYVAWRIDQLRNERD